MKILISACLLGEKCKYNGKDNYNEEVTAFCQGKEVIAVCPEMMSGMGSPRTPVEIVHGRIVDKNGVDRDEIYRGGIAIAVKAIEGEKIELAILKARSPTCGVHEIYDGTFTGTRISGEGIFAKVLRKKGIPIFDEEEMDKVFLEKHKEEL